MGGVSLVGKSTLSKTKPVQPLVDDPLVREDEGGGEVPALLALLGSAPDKDNKMQDAFFFSSCSRIFLYFNI